MAKWHGKKTVRIIDTTQSQQLLERLEIENSISNFKKSCTNWQSLTHDSINLFNGFSATLEDINDSKLIKDYYQKSKIKFDFSLKDQLLGTNLADQENLNDASEMTDFSNSNSDQSSSKNTTPAHPISPNLFAPELTASESLREVNKARDETITLLSTMLKRPTLKLVLVNEYLENASNLNDTVQRNLLEMTPLQACLEIVGLGGFSVS